jgi:hypothetical protein
MGYGTLQELHHHQALELQFRAEFFNIFNRVNFFDEDVTRQPNHGNVQRLSGGTFGTFRAGQAGDPRIGQLALELFF